MPLKLYGFKLSSCTRRVAVVCKELDIPYDLIPVDILKGEQRSPEHLARQPFGVVPTIEDDTLSLFESRAIGRYLVAKYGPGSGSTLVPDPSDIVATAKFEQAMSIENNNFDPTGGQLAFELLLKPVRGMQTDEARVKELLATMGGKLDTLTLADLFHLPWAYALTEKANLDLIPSRPNVARWYKDINERPSWQAVKDGA
ncbi:glutathione S-transferase-like protein [Mycena leptocephala]|nr:glutathione S-transferase-like protein [Mycena leptocephala]